MQLTDDQLVLKWQQRALLANMLFLNHTSKWKQNISHEFYMNNSLLNAGPHDLLQGEIN